MAELIQFDDRSGARIARVVIAAERAFPRAKPLTFTPILESPTLPQPGQIRLGKITSTWSKGTLKTVTRLRGSGNLFTPSSTFHATNYFADIVVDCGERKVALAHVDSTWILIAAEC